MIKVNRVINRCLNETDSIEEALEELGEDEFNEMEIRLMRIKFFSDYGN